MTPPAITLDALSKELAPYTQNSKIVAQKLLPFFNDHLSEAYLAGTLSGEDGPDPVCPIPKCGETLVLNRSLKIPVTGSVVPDIDLADAVSQTWNISCTTGHVVDSGGSDVDGRDAADGWRDAHRLGGHQ